MIGARITIGLLTTAVAAVIVGCTPAAEPKGTRLRQRLRPTLLRHTRPRPWRPSSNRRSQTSRARPSPRRS